MKNIDILSENFKPVSTNPLQIGDWKTFLELSRTARIIWHPKAGLNIDKIDLNSNPSEKLYVFTDLIPGKLIYDFIDSTNHCNWLSADVQDNPLVEHLDIITLSINELELSSEIELCYEKRLLNAIVLGRNIDGLKIEFNNQVPKVKYLTPNSFHKFVKSLIHDKNKTLIGRTFLMSLMVGKSNTARLTRQYILYMFVGNDYFENTFIKGLGLHCERSE